MDNFEMHPTITDTTTIHYAKDINDLRDMWSSAFNSLVNVPENNNIPVNIQYNDRFMLAVLGQVTESIKDCINADSPKEAEVAVNNIQSDLMHLGKSLSQEAPKGDIPEYVDESYNDFIISMAMAMVMQMNIPDDDPTPENDSDVQNMLLQHNEL